MSKILSNEELQKYKLPVRHQDAAHNKYALALPHQDAGEKWAEGPHRDYSDDDATDVAKEQFLRPPTASKLDKVSKYLSVCKRITYGVAGDVARPFHIKADSQDVAQLEDVNTDLRILLRDIKFYPQMELWVAYRRIFGAGILILLEKGNKYPWTSLEAPLLMNITECIAFDPETCKTHRAPNGEIDYYELSISIGPKTLIKVHPSRVIYLNDWGIEDGNCGLGELRPIWPETIVILNIIEAHGELAYRWGTGHPVFLTEKDTTEAQMTSVKTWLGDPTRHSWHLMPPYIKEMVMMTQGQGIDLPALDNNMLVHVSISSEIPRPILNGEVAGVSEGSEVNERSYYNVIEREQKRLLAPLYHFLQLLRDHNAFPLPDDGSIEFEVRFVENKKTQTENLEKLVGTVSMMTQCTFREQRRQLRQVGRIQLDTDDDVEKKYGEGALDAIPALEAIKSQEEFMKNGSKPAPNKEKEGEDDKEETPKQIADAIIQFDAQRPVGITQFCKDAGISPPTYYKIIDEVKKHYANSRSVSP